MCTHTLHAARGEEGFGKMENINKAGGRMIHHARMVKKSAGWRDWMGKTGDPNEKVHMVGEKNGRL